MLLRCRVALCCSSAAAVERMKFRRDRASGAKRGRRKHTQVGLPLGGQLLCLSDEQLARNGLVVLPRRLCASAWSVSSGATQEQSRMNVRLLPDGWAVVRSVAVSPSDCIKSQWPCIRCFYRLAPMSVAIHNLETVGNCPVSST